MRDKHYIWLLHRVLAGNIVLSHNRTPHTGLKQHVVDSFRHTQMIQVVPKPFQDNHYAQVLRAQMASAATAIHMQFTCRSKVTCS